MKTPFPLLTLLFVCTMALLTTVSASAESQGTASDITFTGRTKDIDIARVLHAVKQLTNLAAHNSESGTVSAANMKRIHKIIRAVKAIEYVAVMAAMCRAILSDGNAEDQTYDCIMEQAYWSCIAQIAADPSPEAAMRLQQFSIGQDGWYKLHIEEYIEVNRKVAAKHQKAASKPKHHKITSQ